MLYIIGLGLSTIEDISVSGLNAIKTCDHVFIDAYTSILTHGIERISEFCGKDVKSADREFTEQNPLMISLAKNETVAFLVVGDPLGATTHTDLIIRAIKEGIPYKVIHNTSIMTAVGCCGIHLYRLGETISIPLWGECGSPESFYPKIMSNYHRKLHTLCLLDIKVKEKSLENLLRNREIYEPPRFMNCAEAAYQILEAGRRIKQRFDEAANDPDAELPCEPAPEVYMHPDCIAICLARVGTPTQAMVVTTMGTLESCNSHDGDAEASDETDVMRALGGPMHSMIIPGELHPVEVEFLTARLLAAEQAGDHANDKGTALPVLLPPSPSGDVSLADRVDAMFKRHHELLNGK